MNTTSIPIPPLEPQRGSSLVGNAYWVMLQRVTLIAAAIDVGYSGISDEGERVDDRVHDVAPRVEMRQETVLSSASRK